MRITLKRPYSDGTVAIDMDRARCWPGSPPAPRRHTVRYGGVLAAASKVRARIVPSQRPESSALDGEVVDEGARTCTHGGTEEEARPRKGSRYWSWSELLLRAFEIDILTCLACKGAMRLVAVVTEPSSIARYPRGIGEPCPRARRPGDWKSRVMRRAAGHADPSAA